MKIFITGASDGIGGELAKQLAGQGHGVWGVARRENKLKELQEELGKEKFNFSVCDVSKENEVGAAVFEMKKSGFLPDIVILNAALFAEDVGTTYRHDLLKKSYDTNFFGALAWVEKFLPDFLKRGSGKFIAISSVAAFRPNPKSISLSSGKAALSMAFRGLRLRYGKENIGFSNVYLGPVATRLVPAWSSGGKPRYPFVLTSEKAAEKIARILNKKAGDYWIPFFTTLLLRISLFLPDRVFATATRYLKDGK